MKAHLPVPTISHGPKTSIADIPEANERIYGEVARLTKTTPIQVEEIVGFVGKFTADLIERGDMEGVMIPYFGKFRPKVKHLQLIKKIEQGKETGMLPIYKAIKQVMNNAEGRVYEDVRPRKGNQERRTEKGRTTAPVRKPRKK